MIKQITLSTSILFTSALGALAEPELLATTAGDWQIIRDTSDGQMCLMQSQFQDETHVQLIVDANSDKILLSLLNAGWSMVADQEYPIEIHLDGSEYEGHVVGYDDGEMNGLFLDIENPEFLQDLMQAKTLSLIEDGNAIMAYDLIGTMQAVPAVFECLK